MILNLEHSVRHPNRRKLFVEFFSRARLYLFEWNFMGFRTYGNGTIKNVALLRSSSLLFLALIVISITKVIFVLQTDNLHLTYKSMGYADFYFRNRVLV